MSEVFVKNDNISEFLNSTDNVASENTVELEQKLKVLFDNAKDQLSGGGKKRRSRKNFSRRR